MAIIKPFRGIRPPQDLVERVASRPYDVLNSAEARAEAEGNEMSLYHIIRPEIDFPVGTDEHEEKVYQKAAENFRLFRDKGWLVQDAQENYYVYAQTMNGKTQYGLVVCAAVEDYMNGVIKKHELTRRDKEEDRMKHVRVNNANIEPVFFAYPAKDEINKIVAKYTQDKPVYSFIAPLDGFGHDFWIINDAADIQRITELFAEARQPVRLIAHCREGIGPDRVTIDRTFTPQQDVLVAIGPEGDFTTEELEEGLRLGFTPITLGESRLRTETAGLIALQWLHTLSMLHPPCD